jgi:hypothetical protein
MNHNGAATRPIDGCTIRAIAGKNTLTGSLACSATRQR